MAEPQRTGSELQTANLAKEESRSMVIWRRFRKNKAAVFGLVVLVILSLTAIFAPLIAKENWDFLDLVAKRLPPSSQHWFGTDQFGRDVFSRLVWGARISLSIGFVVAFVVVTIGSAWGAVAGYYAGTWLDVTMMRIAEAINSIPLLFLLIVVSAIVSRGIYTEMLAISLTSWSGLAFLVRGQFLSLRNWDFVQAAQAMGARDRRIIFRHILPNVVGLVLVNTTLRIGNVILLEATLNFLGFGTPPPFPTWGETISVGRYYMLQAPWITIFPGLLITLTVLAFNFVGDGLRDALDPKMKH